MKIQNNKSRTRPDDRRSVVNGAGGLCGMTTK